MRSSPVSNCAELNAALAVLSRLRAFAVALCAVVGRLSSVENIIVLRTEWPFCVDEQTSMMTTVTPVWRDMERIGGGLKRPTPRQRPTWSWSDQTLGQCPSITRTQALLIARSCVVIAPLRPSRSADEICSCETSFVARHTHSAWGRRVIRCFVWTAVVQCCTVLLVCDGGARFSIPRVLLL
jgi:hypothetical protein